MRDRIPAEIIGRIRMFAGAAETAAANFRGTEDAAMAPLFDRVRRGAPGAWLIGKAAADLQRAAGAALVRWRAPHQATSGTEFGLTIAMPTRFRDPRWFATEDPARWERAVTVVAVEFRVSDRTITRAGGVRTHAMWHALGRRMQRGGSRISAADAVAEAGAAADWARVALAAAPEAPDEIRFVAPTADGHWRGDMMRTKEPLHRAPAVWTRRGWRAEPDRSRDASLPVLRTWIHDETAAEAFVPLLGALRAAGPGDDQAAQLMRRAVDPAMTRV